jgi:predicted dehydrogenase
VVGAGAFGRNHLRVYRELEGAELVAVVDRDEAVVAEALAALEAKADPFGMTMPKMTMPKGFASVEALLASGMKVDAASVCVPTVHHLAAAKPLLEAGIDVLVEKPLAASLADADELIAVAAKHGRVLQVGHLERFNPAVTAVKGKLTRPMFFEAHRLSVFTARSLDVDVVLDLMIHDLDIVLSLVASDVREVRAVGLPVLSHTVDIANVRVEFENGCVANFTASRVSTERVRKLRFFQPHQYLSLDFARQDLLLIDVTAAAGLSTEALKEMIETHSKPGAAHPSAGLSMSKVPVEMGEPLKLELESFLGAVRERTVPVVDGVAGRRALGLALEINAAIAAHLVRAGLV